MKTIIVIGVVVVIAFFSIRSVIRMVKGEGGCQCSKDKSCSLKGHCPTKKK